MIDDESFHLGYDKGMEEGRRRALGLPIVDEGPDYNTAPWLVGDVIHGFCGGYFGRDFWGPAKVEAIGSDWVLFRTRSGGVAVVSGEDVGNVKEYRDPKWKDEWDANEFEAYDDTFSDA